MISRKYAIVSVLILPLLLSACAAPKVSNVPVSSASASGATTGVETTQAPNPALSPSVSPDGVYLTVTGEKGKALIIIVRYKGGDSVSDKKNGDNYTTDERTVDVPSATLLTDTKHLNQITVSPKVDQQLLGCDIYVNGKQTYAGTPMQSPLNSAATCGVMSGPAEVIN